MNQYLYGFLWSIFLLTFFWNYTLCLTFVILFFLIFRKRHYFLLWSLLWILSVVCFNLENKPVSILWEWSFFVATIQKTVWTDKYEISIEDKSYLLRSSKHLENNTTVSWYVKKNEPPKSIMFSWKNFDIHSLVLGKFDYNKRLFIKGYWWDLQASKIIVRWSNKRTVRWIFETSITNRYWTTKEAWLLQWMIIWWRKHISKDQYQNFIDSWLVHIIAVSWWNIMMVILFANIVFFFVPVKLRRLCIWVLIIFYLLLCGFDSSIIRAVIFALVNILIIFLWTRLSFKRLLLYTLTILLIYNPYFLMYDVWLLLSIWALLGIYIWSKYFKTGFQIVDYYITPSFFAWLWVMPVLILFMWKFNILGSISTIILWPLLPPLLIMWVMSLLVNISLLTLGVNKALSFIYKVSEYWHVYWVYIIIEWFYMTLSVMLWLLLVYWCLYMFMKQKH